MGKRKLSGNEAATIGMLLGLLYGLGMPAAFLTVEVLAVIELGPRSWVAWALLGVVLWNVWVLSYRLVQLAALLARNERAHRGGQ